MKDHDSSPGEQRGYDFKRGILRGGTYQNDESAFHMGQKGILLSLIKTVNLIHKQDSWRSMDLAGLLCLLNNLPELLDPGGHGRKGMKWIL
jgi:hypothetical protein